MADHIPKEFLELVLQRIDLVALIDARVPLRKKTGNNYFACCPFHQEKTASFSVSHSKQFYYCFGCGAHGNAIDFLMNYDRLRFPEAVETLAKQIGMAVPHSKTSEKALSFQHLYTTLDEAAAFYHAQLRQAPKAFAYIKQRGISEEIIRTFRLGYAPRGDTLLQTLGKTEEARKALQETGILNQKDTRFYDRFHERIIFPIDDRRGRCVGFGGRVMDNSEPKYLNSPETPLFQKGHELYGLHQALQVNRQLPRLLIVEGYMDMISLFQYGITYAAATLGTATTAYQVQSLFRYTSEIVFCFDGDNAGRRAAWRALQVILPIVPDHVQFRFLFLPDNEDPDSLVRREGKIAFEKRVTEAQTLSQYLFQTLMTDIDLSTVDGKTRYINAALEHIKHLPEGIFKNALLTDLRQKTRTDISLSVEKQSVVSTRPKTSSNRSSLLRYALSLLIQFPDLAQHVTEPIPSGIIPGTELFNQILEIAQQKKTLSTGTLLEFFRTQPEEKWLASLAQEELSLPQNGLLSEFLGAIHKMRKQIKAHFIQKMLEKAALGSLSSEEKHELNQLIIEKE